MLEELVESRARGVEAPAPKKRGPFAPAPIAPAVVKPIRMEVLRARIRGIVPLLQNRWSEKATAMMMQTQTRDEESQTRERSKRKVRPAREFEREVEDKTYRAQDGWPGLPASSLRNAIIDACKTTDITMTSMRRAVFIRGQGSDHRDGRALLQIQRANSNSSSRAKGRKSAVDYYEPAMDIQPVKIGMATTTISARPRWDDWEIMAEIEFDSDAISAESLHNLLQRAGSLIGIGEGRPDSKKSHGTNNGRFEVVEAEHVAQPRKGNGK